MKVFVYGTLKKGFHANDLLGDSQYLKEATIKGKMVSMEGFPAVTDGDNDIKGEIWEL